MVGFSAEDPNIRSAYVYQYNYGYPAKIRARICPSKWITRAAPATSWACSSITTSLQVIVNNPAGARKSGAQRANLSVSDLRRYRNVGKDIGNSNYNGMVATAKYQSRKGYFLQASYTVSHSIDDNSAFFGSTGEVSTVAERQ